MFFLHIVIWIFSVSGQQAATKCRYKKGCVKLLSFWINCNCHICFKVVFTEFSWAQKLFQFLSRVTGQSNTFWFAPKQYYCNAFLQLNNLHTFNPFVNNNPNNRSVYNFAAGYCSVVCSDVMFAPVQCVRQFRTIKLISNDVIYRLT